MTEKGNAMAPTQNDPSAGNRKLSAVLIASDHNRRRAIAAAISAAQASVYREFNEYPEAAAVAKLIASGCDAIVVIDLEGGVEPGLAFIEAICRQDISVTVMACSSSTEADVVIRAMHAGAREFISLPVAAGTLAGAFARASVRQRAVTMERSVGKVLVFQGAKGGTGVTTLATNFAVALTRENSGKVALLDMHPQLGEISLGLGIAPRFSVVDALENASRLDPDFLTTLLTRHESGLMVLGSADAYGTDRSLERGAEKLLRIMREEFAFVVVDAGSCSGNIPDVLFEMADSIYLVTEVNLPALRNARRLISYFSSKKDLRNLEVVLNRFNSRTVEIDEESTIKALSRPVDWKVPNDYMSVRGAQNLGIPLVQQDSPISRVICQMAKAAQTNPVGSHNPPIPESVKGDKWKFWTSNNIRPLSTARS
jgi:pilus assembly protein CpaE